MHVAQIAQSRLILVAHPLGELRIIQPFIPRELRHVLQDTQSLLNRLAPVLRHLSPLRPDIVPNVILLRRREVIPNTNPLLQLLPLRRSHPVEAVVILDDLLLLLRI